MTDNKPTVQEKSAWAKVPQEFNAWWNNDYSDESNPFRINSAAYWAWAGWSEAVRLNAQAVPDGYALVDREALDMAINALRRDVNEGRPIRGEIADRLSAAPAAPQSAQQPLTDDPCPGCQVGTVCRTPKCGRLKLPVDHPLRTGVKND